MSTPIEKPIFFIGVPRSGTTLLFEIFAVHPELVWFSNLSERFLSLPFPVAAALSRISRIPILRGANPQGYRNKIKGILPHPVEAYKFWESCCGTKFRFDYLLGTKACYEEKTCVRKAVRKLFDYQKGIRFITKITGPGRIGYINSIFPDAQFVHVIRDGRAVINSLHNVNFWVQRGGLKKPWWENGLTDEDLDCWHNYGESSYVLAALQWRRIILLTRKEAKEIAAEKYIEIKYEDFIRNPDKKIDELFQFCFLSPDNSAHDYLRTFRIKSMNYKYRSSIPENELKVIEVIMKDVLDLFNY